MPEVFFEKGNLVFQNDGSTWDMTSNTEEPIVWNLADNGNSYTETVMFQPGVFKGWIVYVGINSCNADVNFQFGLRPYDVGATELLLSMSWTNIGPVIPAGKTGYFCMDPALTAESLRNWAARDQMALRFQRSNSTGSLQDVTIAVMYEITEEYVLDNDYDIFGTNLPRPI